MNINDLNTNEQLEQFLTGDQAVAFLVASNKFVSKLKSSQKMVAISVKNKVLILHWNSLTFVDSPNLYRLSANYNYSVNFN